MKSQFILSLFPGVDILGRAFHQAGHTVVRGPDLVTGDRIEDFHGLPGHVDGIIAGPPCQDFSCLRRAKPSGHGKKMLSHLLRVANECDCTWILVENVPGVPSLYFQGERMQRIDLTDIECGGIQLRRRHWQWWHRDGLQLHPTRLTQSQARSVTPAVTATPRSTQPRNYHELCRRMGLPAPIHPAGWSHAAKCRAIGNAVTWPMATTMAAAASQAIAGVVTPRLCICGCGRQAPRLGDQATAACRKRMERRRRSMGHTVKG
jgi:DNA (cytosine-5)-methyltransferase 1